MEEKKIPVKGDRKSRPRGAELSVTKWLTFSLPGRFPPCAGGSLSNRPRDHHYDCEVFSEHLGALLDKKTRFPARTCWEVSSSGRLTGL